MHGRIKRSDAVVIHKTMEKKRMGKKRDKEETQNERKSETWQWGDWEGWAGIKG